MKNLTAFLLLLIFCSCSNTNEAVLNLIAKNNKHYVIELEEYKAELEQRREDMPSVFDKDYFQNIDSSFTAIKKLKTKADYDTVFEKIKGLGYELKIGETIKRIESNEPEILKNNLYVNLLNVVHAKKVASALALVIGCRLSEFYKVVKTTKNDSVHVDFYTFNNLRVNIDNEYDNDGHDQYESNQQFKVWSIKYKPNSENTHCSGKILFKEPDYGRMLMVQEFDDRNALKENPFE